MSNRITRRTLAAATAVVIASMAAGPALAGKADTTGLTTHGNDRFIVKYREGTAERADVANVKAALNRAARATAGGKGLALGHVRRLAVGAEAVQTDRKLDRVAAEALMQQIAADPSVEYVEVDRIMRPVYTPNDTYYANNQWHYFEAAGGIRADQAWDVTNGSGVVVAVLDTGITTHSDLGSNIVGGYDFIGDAAMARDGNGRDSNAADQGDWAAAGECYSGSPASNSSWHGTHVTGTVAALTNNAKGMAGVAFGSRVVPVRVLGKCGGYTSDITDGIIWASGGSVTGVPANPYPAKVINMSLGGGGACSSTYQNAINAAVNRGTTVVVAAGNSNADTSGFTPASCSNVIAVASTTRTGARSSFSNYGSLIDVAAPGSDIGSTVNSGTTTPSTEGYSLMSGTSMASPHVAGVAALMIAKAGGSLAPSTVESTLKSTLRAFPTTIDKPIGNGIVNAKAAVDAVGGGTAPPPSGNTLANGVAVTNLSASTGNSVEYTMDVPSGASNLSFVISGGTGDADMYVKFGSAPTDSSYDCRPYQSGNEETCSFPAPQAGKYYVRVKAYSSYSGVSLKGSYSTASSSTQTYTNGSNYTISDNATVESPISVSNRTGYGLNPTSVSVNIVHTYIGDLKVDLIAPDGSVYVLHNRSGGSADNINATYSVNLSSELRNGTWKLRVNDNYSGDTGYINSWSITF